MTFNRIVIAGIITFFTALVVIISFGLGFTGVSLGMSGSGAMLKFAVTTKGIAALAGLLLLVFGFALQMVSLVIAILAERKP